jgi:hypothetical protein
MRSFPPQMQLVTSAAVPSELLTTALAVFFLTLLFALRALALKGTTASVRSLLSVLKGLYTTGATALVRDPVVLLVPGSMERLVSLKLLLYAVRALSSGMVAALLKSRLAVLQDLFSRTVFVLQALDLNAPLD